MITRKIVIGALLIIISAIGVKVFTHSHLSKEEKVNHITEKMSRKLSLSEEQKTKVYQINLERANGHEEAHKQGSKREVIQSAVAKWESDLEQVLTPEQAQKLRI